MFMADSSDAQPAVVLGARHSVGVSTLAPVTFGPTSDLECRPLSRGDEGVITFLDAAGSSATSALMSLLDQSDDCVKFLRPDGSLTYMSCSGLRVMEIDDFAPLQDKPWPSLWPEDGQQVVKESIAAGARGEHGEFEAFCPTGKGTPKWWHVTVSPIFGQDGQVAALLGSSRDITERKQREEAMLATMTEMRHRLRNAFSISASMAMLSARETPEAEAFARELASKLSRLADVQSALIDGGGGARLRQLMRRIAEAFDGGSRFDLSEMDDCRLGENAARALALVVGELCTNSVKYGALGSSGSVRVSAQCLPGEGLNIAWRETRGDDGPVATVLGVKQHSGGEGRGLQERMLRAVGGSIEARVTATGYEADIHLRDVAR